MWRKLAILTLMALLGLGVQVASAQSATWKAEFYNNAYLVGDPVLTRQDSAIAFDWTLGSPASGVNVDNFSVRWAADPFFLAGTYRFYALADDSVCVWVDFQKVINTFDQARVGETLGADVALSGGVHHIQVDYRENWGNAYVYVSWANLATYPTGPNFPAPISTTSPTSSWSAQYYSNTVLSGYPTLMQVENWPLARDWGSGAPVAYLPADYFSARWTTTHILEGGTYRLTALADDGVRVFVDGQLLINEFHNATGITYTAYVALGAGTHNIIVEYYEAMGLAFARFDLARVDTPIYQPIVAPVSAASTARVVADVLNLRQSPNCECSVLVKVRQGETYPIIGRNADSSWWQVNVNGTIGWLYSRFVEALNTATVPVTDQSATPQATPSGYDLQTALTTIIRSRPGNRYAFLGQLPTNTTAQIVGRNWDGSWWRINYNGVIGWVKASATRAPLNMDMTRIPIVG